MPATLRWMGNQLFQAKRYGTMGKGANLDGEDERLDDPRLLMDRCWGIRHGDSGLCGPGYEEIPRQSFHRYINGPHQERRLAQRAYSGQAIAKAEGS